MTELNAAQAAVVQHGTTGRLDLPEGAPDINVEIIDAGILTEDMFMAGCGSGFNLRPAPNRDSIGGKSWIYEIAPEWQAKRDGQKSTHYYITDHGTAGWAESQAGAHAKILDHVLFLVRFWMDKVEWKKNGDRQPGQSRRSVIRAGGFHYVLGDQTGPTEFRGFGGREFAFEMLDDGRRVTCSDVWFQGEIPTEFRDLLPDNARQVPSDVEIALKAQHDEDRVYALAKGWTVEQRENGNVQWRDPLGRVCVSGSPNVAPGRYMVDGFERDALDALRAQREAAERKPTLPAWLDSQVFYRMSVLSKDSKTTDDDWYEPGGPEVTTKENANVVSSLIADGNGGHLTLRSGEPLHKVLLDLDVEHAYFPSSTEGHGHLYLNVNLPESDLLELMRLLYSYGITSKGNVYQIDGRADLPNRHRKPQLSLRMPHVTKKEI